MDLLPPEIGCTKPARLFIVASAAKSEFLLHELIVRTAESGKPSIAIAARTEQTNGLKASYAVYGVCDAYIDCGVAVTMPSRQDRARPELGRT